MSSVTIVIDGNNVIEGGQEYELLKLAVNGERQFSMLGNEYIITEVTSEKHSINNFLFGRGNKTTIKAVKGIGVGSVNCEEHF